LPALGRLLVLAGGILVLLGLLLWFVPGLAWLGRLPGDVRVERPGFRLYVPITTCLLISAALSAAPGWYPGSVDRLRLRVPRVPPAGPRQR
jgi:hypothetical protein